MNVNLEKALVTAYMTAVGYSTVTKLPVTEWENLELQLPENCQLWYSVNIAYAQPTVASLGNGGDDEVRGYLQIDINVPRGSGKGILIEKLAALRSYFTAGKRLPYDDAVAVVISTGSSPAREVDSWYRISASVFFYTHLTRP